MIVRIMSEGQWDVSDDELEALNALDQKLVDAIDSGDEAGFSAALETLLSEVRSRGTAVPDDFLGSSDYVLPAPDASLEEVQELLGEEGLLPG